eukprot:GHVO01012823.1.p2 GENE.GHVO01012823.1~~GHVO01012823.1.p2  ORF type:complete len:119 (+),score=7.89 GHVO01012823.1:403-759(+)
MQNRAKRAHHPNTQRPALAPRHAEDPIQTVFHDVQGSASTRIALHLQHDQRIYAINSTIKVSSLLVIPPTKSACGNRSLSVAGPCAWNSLPRDIRHCVEFNEFKRTLKTFLFIEAYRV